MSHEIMQSTWASGETVYQVTAQAINHRSGYNSKTDSVFVGHGQRKLHKDVTIQIYNYHLMSFLGVNFWRKCLFALQIEKYRRIYI